MLRISIAFGAIFHNKSFFQFSSVFFSVQSLYWLQNFLSGRSQRIKLGYNFSEMRLLSSRIIQGLYFSPVLFNIFSNSLLKKLKRIASAYAEDIKSPA